MEVDEVDEEDEEDQFEPGSGYEVLREYLDTSPDAPTEPQQGHLPADGPMYILREVVSPDLGCRCKTVLIDIQT